MYRRSLEGKTFTLGVSGMLLHNALLMFDRETKSLWSHLTGESLAGPMKGRRLETVASVPQVRWDELRRRYPEVRVLSIGTIQDAPRDSYAGYHADPQALGVVPGPAGDRRLPGKTMVIAFRVGKAAKAYPFSALGKRGVIHDTVGGVPVVIARNEDAGASAVYRRTVGGSVLEFESSLVDGHLRERGSGRAWDLLRGAARGGGPAERLEPVPFVNVYWFGWSAYYPRTEIHGRPDR